MTRIFTTLAIFSVGLLCANIVLGLMIGDYNGAFDTFKERATPISEKRQALQRERPRPVEEIAKLDAEIEAESAKLAPIETRAIVHILLGVASALVAVLVNSICMTYFVGTSRWIREVVETYDFPPAWIEEANRVKRGTFPWALGGMLTAVGIIALGAAAHPGTIREGTANWVTPHMIGAMLGTAFIAYAFFVQHQRISANFEIIQRIVAKVKEVRQAKGLDVDEAVAAMAK